MKKILLIAMMIFGCSFTKAQVKNNENSNLNPLGIWISLASGFANDGLALNVSMNVNYKSLLMTARFQGVSEISFFGDPQYLESHSGCALQAGYALKRENFILSATTGIAQVIGVKRGEASLEPGILFNTTTYNMISYTKYAIPFEQKIMTRPSRGYGVSIGADITEDISIDHTSVGVMLCLSLGSF